MMHGPIPQKQDYHNFADNRSFSGIPNFLNVITNLPFFIVGLVGLKEAKHFRDKNLRLIFSTLFTGFLLVALGSGYYHLYPKNITLVFDRIPIVTVLMSFFSYILYDYINNKIGYKAFFIFNIIGIASVIYWIISEQTGNGDLRWYGMVQFFPVVAIPLILVLYKSVTSQWKQILIIFFFFGIAKLNEQFDREVFELLKDTISGHSLKHLFMVAAEFEILVLMRRRIEFEGRQP